MTPEANAAATGLFNKLTREDKEIVATVGVRLSEQGNEVLIPYLRKKPMFIPEYFDGFLVLPESARALRLTEK